LRHVAFSSDEDFLVISAEDGGGLATYGVEDLLSKKQSNKQLSTDQIPVRALVPNPNPQFGHYFAAVLDSGALIIVDVANQKTQPLHRDNVTCVAWSIRGQALVAGLKDGSAIQYKTDGALLATVPCPPDVDPGYTGECNGCSIELVC
jgi:nucleoporin NUP159